jgi:hypothetical protein
MTVACTEPECQAHGDPLQCVLMGTACRCPAHYDFDACSCTCHPGVTTPAQQDDRMWAEIEKANGQ